MNIPIAAIRTSAPIAIAIALVPLNVLLPEVGVWVVGAAIVGVTVCVCWAGVDGVSGVSGLPWPSPDPDDSGTVEAESAASATPGTDERDHRT